MTSTIKNLQIWELQGRQKNEEKKQPKMHQQIITKNA